MNLVIHTIVSWAIKTTPEWYRDSSDAERLDILNCLSDGGSASPDLLLRLPCLIRSLNDKQWDSLYTTLCTLQDENGIK